MTSFIASTTRAAQAALTRHKENNREVDCYLIIDDTVVSKPFATNIDLARYQYSGREHLWISGIDIANLLWISAARATGSSMPNNNARISTDDSPSKV